MRFQITLLFCVLLKYSNAQWKQLSSGNCFHVSAGKARSTLHASQRCAGLSTCGAKAFLAYDVTLQDFGELQTYMNKNNDYWVGYYVEGPGSFVKNSVLTEYCSKLPLSERMTLFCNYANDPSNKSKRNLTKRAYVSECGKSLPDIWELGGPNNNEPDGLCVRLDYMNNGWSWNDKQCDARNIRYICQAHCSITTPTTPTCAPLSIPGTTAYETLGYVNQTLNVTCLDDHVTRAGTRLFPVTCQCDDCGCRWSGAMNCSLVTPVTSDPKTDPPTTTAADTPSSTRVLIPETTAFLTSVTSSDASVNTCPPCESAQVTCPKCLASTQQCPACPEQTTAPLSCPTRPASPPPNVTCPPCVRTAPAPRKRCCACAAPGMVTPPSMVTPPRRPVILQEAEENLLPVRRTQNAGYTAADRRPSAIVLGTSGIIVLAGYGALIFVMDIIACNRKLRASA